MISSGVLVVLLIVIHLALVAALGCFLTRLEQDDPKTYSVVATPEKIHFGLSGFYFLGPLAFLLDQIVPKRYEFWSIKVSTRVYADRLRWGTIAAVVCLLIIVGVLLLSWV